MSVRWFLCGNETTPSARIHGINVHDKLVSLGYASQIVHKPHRYMEDLYFHTRTIGLISMLVPKNDTAVFQKVCGARTVKLINKLKQKGVRIVFIDCDLPLKPAAASLADIVVCPSAELCNLYIAAGISNVTFIDDAVETFMPPSTVRKNKKTVLWFGKSGLGKWDAVTWFNREILPSISNRWEFITVSDHKQATFPWKAATAPSIINKADLVVIPVPATEADQVKSANRCTQSLALGVPVLSNNLPSYRTVIRDYHNGLVTDVKEEWISFMKKLENDEYLNGMKSKAFASAAPFSMDEIILKWISLLKPKKNKSVSHLFLNIVRILYVLYYSARKIFSGGKNKPIKQ